MRKSVLTLLALCLSAVAALRGFGSGATEVDVRSVVNSGHVGSVRDLQYDDRRNLLFSAGDDGTVRIWEPDGSLVSKLQVTQLTAASIAVSPTTSEVAVVVTDGTGSYFLSVWDWEKERQLFQVPLKEQPLFLRFSGVGTYLLYGGSSWQSLRVLLASDGTPVQFRPEGFGIVGFAEVSRSEKTIMTYLVSGRLVYWDLSTGEQTLDLPCTPYLSSIRISSDLRYLVGSTGHEIVLVDTLTGAAKSRAAVESAASLDISPQGTRLPAFPGRTGGFSDSGSPRTRSYRRGDSPSRRPPRPWSAGERAASLLPSPGGASWLTEDGDDKRSGRTPLPG